jgi:hypothetical protein
VPSNHSINGIRSAGADTIAPRARRPTVRENSCVPEGELQKIYFALAAFGNPASDMTVRSVTRSVGIR